MFTFHMPRSSSMLATLAGLLSWSASAHAGRLPFFVPAQMEYVSASQGYLGVDLRDLDEPRAHQLNTKGTQGTEIVALDHDAPACKAGLRLQDVITAINGQSVANADQVRRVLRELPAGKHVVIAVVRSGKPVEVKLQLADRQVLAQQAWKRHFHVPDGAPMIEGFAGGQRGFLNPGIVMPPTDGGPLHLGVFVRAMEPQLATFFGAKDGTGLLIESVEAGSPAAAAGLKAGDVILKANDTPVTSSMDLIGVIHGAAGRPVQLTILRDHQEQRVSVAVQGMKTESQLAPEVEREQLLTDAEPALDTLRGSDFHLSGPDLQKLHQELADSDAQARRAIEQAQKQMGTVNRDAIEQALAGAREQMETIDRPAMEKQLSEAMKQAQAVDMPAMRKQIDEAMRTMREAMQKNSGSSPAGMYPY